MEKNRLENGYLKFDLQRFADGEEFGGYDPSTAYEGIETGTPATPEGGGEPTPPEPGLETPAAQPAAEPEYLDFGGRKVLATDETRGLHLDFLNQQRYITQLTQQQQFQQQPQAQPQQEQTPSANTAEWDEATWNKFYENPQEVLGSVIQQTIQGVLAEKVDPILEERNWEKEIQRMNDTYHDFGDYTNEIQQILEANPEMQHRLDDAYFRAKAEKLSQQPSPEQLMQNPQFVQQIVSNPQIQQQFLNQYLAGKNQINQQTPNLMGRGSGQSYIPATPENSPTNLREASRLAMKMFGNR